MDSNEMSRIIIQDNSTVPTIDVMRAIINVMADGRVSDDGKCYCYVTVFPRSELAISAEVTKTGTDKFTAWDKKGGEDGNMEHRPGG